ncbi:MAG: class I SAM-dependent methyltransferase [Haloechinothrix sp.]
MTEIQNTTAIQRLHWGCGRETPAGWINSDIRQHEGVDLVCDILEGLPLSDQCIDYIVSQHVLPELGIYQQVPALRELRRVLKSGGVLRLSLPDLDRVITAYQRGDRDYFLIWDWDTVAGNFITQILWYNTIRTPFTYGFAEELLHKAGFVGVRRVSFGETTSCYPEIVELDNREAESFYVEAYA